MAFDEKGKYFENSEGNIIVAEVRETLAIPKTI